LTISPSNPSWKGEIISPISCLFESSKNVLSEFNSKKNVLWLCHLFSHSKNSAMPARGCGAAPRTATEWSMTKIGEMLKVSRDTIRTDLQGIERAPRVDASGRRHVARFTHAAIKPTIIEELKAGASQGELERKYGVSRHSIGKWNKELELGTSTVEDRHDLVPSSSKIPEDQIAAFFKLLDEGRTKAEAYTEVAGKPVGKSGLPTPWRHAITREESRRETLAELAQQQTVTLPVQEQPLPSTHRHTCPHCHGTGWVEE
jgi:hypothetical protein